MSGSNHAEEVHYTESGASHIAPIAVYFKTWIVLLVLMVLTISAAQQNFGAANNFIALGIATTKALLVIAYFMQVKGSTRLTVIWAAMGFATLPFLFAIIVDYATRTWLPVIGWQ